ncbi:MAG: cell division protein ZapA [Verminephrobacter sp.]|nr:cell division protein ZapA [Verminephrobacter sp.]
MKQIEVQILQQSYLLACPDGQESRLLDAVERVDTAMTRIRDAGKVRARERIAVLAALNLAFEVADRDAAAAQAAAQPAPAAAPISAVAPTEGDTLRLQSLLSRLDQALGQDGQLL